MAGYVEHWVRCAMQAWVAEASLHLLELVAVWLVESASRRAQVRAGRSFAPARLALVHLSLAFAMAPVISTGAADWTLQWTVFCYAQAVALCAVAVEHWSSSVLPVLALVVHTGGARALALVPCVNALWMCAHGPPSLLASGGAGGWREWMSGAAVGAASAAAFLVAGHPPAQGSAGVFVALALQAVACELAVANATRLLGRGGFGGVFASDAPAWLRGGAWCLGLEACSADAWVAWARRGAVDAAVPVEARGIWWFDVRGLPCCGAVFLSGRAIAGGHLTVPLGAAGQRVAQVSARGVAWCYAFSLLPPLSLSFRRCARDAMCADAVGVGPLRLELSDPYTLRADYEGGAEGRRARRPARMQHVLVASPLARRRLLRAIVLVFFSC
jgi:hypothetical protein